jgi:hypothetical protein
MFQCKYWTLFVDWPVARMLFSDWSVCDLAGSSTHSVCLWYLEDLVLMSVIDEGIKSPVRCLALSPDNTFLIIGRYACTQFL